MGFMDDDRIQRAFLDEVGELLDNLNSRLLDLENNPEDNEVINEIFRLTHSIKGEAAIVGFMNISSIAHKMEDIFERVRRGVLLVNTEIMNPLFAAYDRMVKLMAAVQQGNDEAGYDVSDILDDLDVILGNDTRKQKAVQPEEKVLHPEDEITKVAIKKESISVIEENFTEAEIGQIEEALVRGEKFYCITITFIENCDMCYPRAFLVYNNLLSCGSVAKTSPDIQTDADDADFQSIKIFILLQEEDDEKLINAVDIDQVKEVKYGHIQLTALQNKGFDLSNIPGYTDMEMSADMILSDEEIKEGELIELEWEKQFQTQNENTPETKGDGNQEKSKKAGSKKTKLDEMVLKKQTIRVDTDRLDTLMNLVGELIINHSRYLQIKNNINETSSISEIKSTLDDATNELERITSMMQMSMMQVRMVPIGYVFSKFPRLVRDLSNMLRKNVKLIIEGETTEIDRAIIELITEPLTHLIRNSIDHGIEAPEDREKAGKPREGNITLRAYQQGSSIYIEISDDGKGMDGEAIKAKAIANKLITPQEGASMTRQEIINLIFQPGFSMKEVITGVSGRGVGMDVVINQIEKLRGTIEIDTTLTKGTNITIILPLTLTIVEALLVDAAHNLFAIPVNIVEETLIVHKSEIKDFDEYQVYNLRDETIAILYLSELVEIGDKKDSEEAFVVVVSYERRKIGIVVDDLIGNQDIVIKALDESLKHLEGVAGATVLGDGKIAIILDIATLVRAKKKEISRAAELQQMEGEVDFDKFYDKLNAEPSSIGKNS